MKTKLIMIVTAVSIAGCSDIHEDKAARDQDGIYAQADKLPANERPFFTAGASRGDPAYLAANPTVADAIIEGRRVRAAEMDARMARGNKLLQQGQDNELLFKSCSALGGGTAKSNCQASVNERMMRQFNENKADR